MIRAFLVIGLVSSIIGGLIAMFIQTRPAMSPTERWGARAMVLFMAGTIFNIGAALAFPNVEWLRILGSILSFGCTFLAMGAVWQIHRRSKELRAKADAG